MLLASVILVLCFYIFLGVKKPAIALITSPLISTFLFFLYDNYEAESAIITTLFIFPVTLIAILFSTHGEDIANWPRVVVEWLIGIILFLALMVGTAMLFGPLSFYIFIAYFVFAGMVISYFLTARHSNNLYIISTIGSCMRQNLPLTMALGTAAQGKKDKRSITLRRIQKWLVQGYSLSDAIKRGYPKCPGYAVAMITAAEKIGQVPYAIKAVEKDMVAKADDKKRIKPVQPMYVVTILIFMFLVVLALMVSVIPRFRRVLDEMLEGQPLPWVSRVVFEISNFLFYQIGYLWVIIAIIFLLTLPISLRIRFRPRKPDKPYLVSRIADWVKWYLPVMRWFEQNYSTVQVIEFMRLSLNTGSSINEAIRHSLSLDINNCFKKRIAKWLAKVEAGENIAVAADQCRLGGTLVWAFDEKVNQGNTLKILEMLESFYRSNYNYRVNLVRYIMGPTITIMIGLMVGFVIFAIFTPMIAIINTLANMVTP